MLTFNMGYLEARVRLDYLEPKVTLYCYKQKDLVP